MHLYVYLSLLLLSCQLRVNAGLKNLSQGLERSNNNYKTIVEQSYNLEAEIEPADAILWHAPPQQILARELSAAEEKLREERAVATLLLAASKNRNYKNKEDEVKKIIYQNFQSYKEKYFKTSRNEEFHKNIFQAQLMLNNICGEAALSLIDQIYLENSYE